MATLEEAHSTRGRANVLRLAMSGRMAEAGLGDEGVREVLDLCLECRACKSECPVGVDVARLKSEFLAGYWQRHGTPLRVRALGQIDRVSHWASPLAPLANWFNAAAPGRWFNERFLGIDRRRALPAWKRETFERWLRRNPGPRASNAQAVSLFNDTFTNYYDPEIGAAALQVLAKGGYAAAVVRPGCCGRPLISQGLLPQARIYAERVVLGLLPIAERGERILFCEPSCLSAVKEDAPSLLRGDLQRKAQTVADACILFEQFAATLDLPLRPAAGRVLLHGHCHQKASIVELDAGCCGMAGSFGYLQKHYDVSKAIAGRRLLPAVNTMAQGDVLVAPGTSCRHQVADLSGTVALHPAVLVRNLLM
jgi:Fe-S oxidoreductase